MFKISLKIAWRNILRNKVTSFINLAGLSLGMACAILIALWVNTERSFDTFHENYHNIYQVMANRNFDGKIFTDPNMVLPLAEVLKQEVPQVSKSAVIKQYAAILSTGNKNLKKNGQFVSNDYFDMFTLKFVSGSAAKAFPDDHSIVLTQSTAKSFFGDADPINQVLKINKDNQYKVSAVIADIPSNSTFQFDYIVPFDKSSPQYVKHMADWVNSSWSVFVQVKDEGQLPLVEKEINHIKKSRDTTDGVSTYFTYPMSKWHLEDNFVEGKLSGGLIEYVNLFTWVAIIIVLIAAINFMNLTTAKSEKRAKETGVMKVLGSGRKRLMLQYFSESVFMCCLAFVLSIGIAWLALPWFADLVGKQLSISGISMKGGLAAFGIVLLTGFICGSYPALYLSSFKPINALKKKLSSSRGNVFFRKSLVVMQFSASVVLIISSVFVFRQIQSVKQRNKGYDANNLLTFNVSEPFRKSFGAFKNELMASGLAQNVSGTSAPLTESWWSAPAPEWPGKPTGTEILFSPMVIDKSFIETADIKLLDGRNFAGQAADSANVLLNKTAAKLMGVKNAVGMSLDYFNSKFTVIGIIDDFVVTSPYSPANPMLFFHSDADADVVNIRLSSPVSLSNSIAGIERIYKKYDTDSPFDYTFVDKEFAAKFYAEELIGKVATVFALLAIFISCLGLFGLAAFTVEQRTKEIGIRKVLGASVTAITGLLSVDFIKLVFISLLVAVPVAWYFMHEWLQNYTYRISLEWWVFALAGCCALAIAFLTVSIQSIKAAMMKPVRNLRSE